MSRIWGRKWNWGNIEEIATQNFPKDKKHWLTALKNQQIQNKMQRKQKSTISLSNYLQSERKHYCVQLMWGGGTHEFGVNTEKTKGGLIKLGNSIPSKTITLRFKGNKMYPDKYELRVCVSIRFHTLKILKKLFQEEKIHACEKIYWKRKI